MNFPTLGKKNTVYEQLDRTDRLVDKYLTQNQKPPWWGLLTLRGQPGLLFTIRKYFLI